MIGLPSLSLAMVAILGLVTYRRRRHWGWLVFSGIALALSLQIKLFTFIFIPAMLAWLLIEGREAKARYRHALWWLVSAGATFVSLAWWHDAWNYGQLVRAQVGDGVRGMGDISMGLTAALAKDSEYLWLAMAGLCVVIARRKTEGVLVIGWLLAALLTLWMHTPVWGHHIMLLSLPLAWMVAYGVAPICEFSWRSVWHWPGEWREWRLVVSRVALSAMVIWIAVSVPEKLRRVKADSQPRGSNAGLLEAIRQDAPKTRWTCIDQPMYAFRAGLKVPPETAVMSIKRIRSGNLTSEQLLQTWETYRPEQIVLARFRYGYGGAEIYDWRCMLYLYENYTAEYDENRQVQYVRNDLNPKPARRAWWDRLSPAGWQK